MSDSWTHRRLGWPGLAVLVAALAAALLWLVFNEERAEPDVAERGPYIGALEEPAIRRAPLEDGGVSAALDIGPRPADPTGRDALYDPQRTRSEAQFPTSGDAGAAAPFEFVLEVGRVARSSGTPAEDTPCEVRVLPVHLPPFNCVVRVMCAGEVLYPNASQSAGYLACETDGRRVTGAEDPDDADGDPRLELNLTARRADIERDGQRVRVVW